MNPAPKLAEAILKRYGKKVETFKEREINDDKTIKTSTVKIKSKNGREYIVTEYLKDNLTDYVTVKRGDKEWKYNRHLDAEVNVIDMISEE